MNQRLVAFFVLLSIHSVAVASQCAVNFSDATLKMLQQEKFVIEGGELRNHTAIKLLSCLGEIDPKVRDGIVYSATSKWLRAGLLEESTVKSMFDILIKTLKQTNQDPNNFTQPFAVLVLSEVVRVDRIEPYLLDEERQTAINVTTNYMRNISDYRGFDDIHGWRHAVAHTADVFLQLSLNKKVTKVQLNQILDALKSQVSPSSNHFYVFGEPKRLAMPFIYVVLRGEHSELEVANYLDNVVSPTPFTDWQSVYNNKKGLAKLHNTRSFVYSILAISGQSKNPALKAMQPKLVELIKKIG